MANTSATGGYLNPAAPTLKLNQFLQTVIVGISGITGPLVRPKWQPNPPKQPAATANWIAFSYISAQQDANAFVAMDSAGVQTLERQEALEIQCTIYGPDCYDTAGILRDGFQISQNLAALKAANMGFTGIGKPTRAPELVNEVWIDRMDMTIYLVRVVQRVYPILSFVGAGGDLRTVLSDGENIIDWLVEEVET